MLTTHEQTLALGETPRIFKSLSQACDFGVDLAKSLLYRDLEPHRLQVPFPAIRETKQCVLPSVAHQLKKSERKKHELWNKLLYSSVIKFFCLFLDSSERKVGNPKRIFLIRDQVQLILLL